MLLVLKEKNTPKNKKKKILTTQLRPMQMGQDGHGVVVGWSGVYFNNWHVA